MNARHLPPPAAPSSSSISGQVLAEFDYRFVSRHVGAFWAGGWVGAGTIFTIYSLFFVSEGNKLALLGLWGILLLLIAWSLWNWRDTKTLMQPVTVTDQGIAHELRPEEYDFWAHRNPGFIAFDDITEIAMLAQPDQDADSRRWGVSAIRIRSKDKKIVVWKIIRDWDRLCALIESEMRRRGKPLRVSPKDVEIPAGTGMAVVVYP